MKYRKPRRPRPAAAPALALGLLALLGAAAGRAQVAPAASQPAASAPSAWTARDVSGREVKVPGSQTSLVLFLMADQPQSREALAQTVALLAQDQGVRLIVVVSGDKAPQFTARLAEERKWPGAIVADADYALVGQAAVHVWPTAQVLLPSGERLGHLPGFPASYAHDLAAYLDCAAGKIDRGQLAKQLAEEGTIDDSPQQVAHRHLHVAEQLLGQGQPEAARTQLRAGLKLQPDDTMLLLALAAVDISLKDSDAALAILDGLPAGAVPKWQTSLLRGRALMAKGQWDAAAAVLPAALELNPQPAEAHYLLGLLHQHQGQWEPAAGDFRRAFEATREARKLAPAPER
jgi:predicted negative regulator of RcsB-dependent stress response